MEQQRYKIIFSGRIAAGKTPGEVKQAMASLMQARVFQIEKLFSGRAVVIKKEITSEVAARYVSAFREVGAIVEVKPLDTSITAFPTATTLPADLPIEEDWPEQSVQPAPIGHIDSAHQSPAGGFTNVEDSPMIASGGNPTKEHGRHTDESPFLGAIVFVFNLIFSLVFSAIVVGALVLFVLWLTGGLEFFGFSSISAVWAAFLELVQRF